MKKLLLILLAVGCATLVQASTKFTDGDFFDTKHMPRELKAKVFERETITFDLEENATTGYMWLAEYDDDDCYVEIEHLQAPRPPMGPPMIGAPGRARISIKALRPGYQKVYLRYARSWERNGKAIRKITVILDAKRLQVAPPPPPPRPAPAPRPDPRPDHRDVRRPDPAPPLAPPPPNMKPAPKPAPQPGPGRPGQPPKPGQPHGRPDPRDDFDERGLPRP